MTLAQVFVVANVPEVSAERVMCKLSRAEKRMLRTERMKNDVVHALLLKITASDKHNTGILKLF